MAILPDNAKRQPWLWGLLLSIYFLLLLGVGIWLMMPGSGVSDGIRVIYFAVLIVSIAGLFFRTLTFDIDRRNYIELSRSQWLGRRGRSKKDDIGGK
jgi:hypothetical protein